MGDFTVGFYDSWWIYTLGAAGVAGRRQMERFGNPKTPIAERKRESAQVGNPKTHCRGAAMKVSEAREEREMRHQLKALQPIDAA